MRSFHFLSAKTTVLFLYHVPNESDSLSVPNQIKRTFLVAWKKTIFFFSSKCEKLTHKFTVTRVWQMIHILMIVIGGDFCVGSFELINDRRTWDTSSGSHEKWIWSSGKEEKSFLFVRFSGNLTTWKLLKITAHWNEKFCCQMMGNELVAFWF